ncbi:MAG: hypothetical protein ACRDN0_37785 [Trebonia sp.]
MPFGRPETESFRFTRTMDVDDAVGWLATNSAFITASPADREAGLVRCRAALLAHAGDSADGSAGDSADGSRIEMLLRSWCWRADRLPRP